MFNFVALVARRPDTWRSTPRRTTGRTTIRSTPTARRSTRSTSRRRRRRGRRPGKRFVVVPTGLKLPPDGRTTRPPILPESYSCIAKLGAKKLAGSGTGGCTVAVPEEEGSREAADRAAHRQLPGRDEGRPAHVQGHLIRRWSAPLSAAARSAIGMSADEAKDDISGLDGGPGGGSGVADRGRRRPVRARRSNHSSGRSTSTPGRSILVGRHVLHPGRRTRHDLHLDELPEPGPLPSTGSTSSRVCRMGRRSRL